MDYFDCPGKKTWPELVGAFGRDAKTVIESENRYVVVRIVRVGQPVTQDFRCDRVRVYVDEGGVVVRVPHIG